MTLLLFILGLLLLVGGAELLVRGASRLALAVGLTPLVVGLTVVAFGTSSPELAVSAVASINGEMDISLGNVVGSNIFNVLCVLGLSAAIKPLPVSMVVIREQTPIMIGVSLVALLLAMDGNVGRVEGALLVVGIVVYTVVLVTRSRASTRAGSAGSKGESSVPGDLPLIPPLETPIRGGTPVSLLLISVGLGLLVLGSAWLVDSASAMAVALGISQITVGLTIVAVGTSLPELATSLVATLKGEREIAVGNVVGSNIFNLLAILGLAAAVSPAGIAAAPRAVFVDIPFMAFVALACLPVFATGRRVARSEGVFFLMAYGVYTFMLVRDATG